MKKFFNYSLFFVGALIGFSGFYSTSVSAQVVPSSNATQPYAPYAHPVAIQNVGNQQYTGAQTTLYNARPVTATPTVQVAPTINSVYATPMRRVNEIPLYGKNKNLYFYGENKKDDTPFHDSGLYLFASYSTGKNKNGVNAEKSIYNDDGVWFGGSDAHDSMGTANGFTLGIGREMSDSMSIEFSYSKYSGMKYGDYVYFNEEEETGEEDEDGNPIIGTVVNNSTLEVIDGGNISSSFIGIGLKYNLDRFVGSLGGRLKPYVAVSVGLVENDIKNYTVNNPGEETSGEVSPDEWEPPEEGEDGPSTVVDYIKDVAKNYGTCSSPDTCNSFVDLTSQSDGEFTFVGKSKRNVGYSAEVGLSLALGGALSLDLFYRLNRFGSVETSGNILSTYTETTSDWYVPENYDTWTLSDIEPNNPQCGDYETYYSDGFSACIGYSDDSIVQTINTRQKEKGDMNFYQYGLKLKYMF